MKLESSIEEVTLLQTELEDLKAYSDEQIERLNQLLQENETELLVKEHKMRELKYSKLFEPLPHQKTCNPKRYTNHFGLS